MELGTKPLTLTLSQREGAPLNWRPSADAVAGDGASWPLRRRRRAKVGRGEQRGPSVPLAPRAPGLPPSSPPPAGGREAPNSGGGALVGQSHLFWLSLAHA